MKQNITESEIESTNDWESTFKLFSKAFTFGDIEKLYFERKNALIELKFDRTNSLTDKQKALAGISLEKFNVISLLWRKKAVREANMSLGLSDKKYSLEFEHHGFEWLKIKASMEKLKKTYEKLFYSEWIKAKLRLCIDENWNHIIDGKNMDLSYLAHHIHNTIEIFEEKLYNEFGDLYNESGIDYSTSSLPSIKKQFVSKLFNTLKDANIEIDAKKFCLSFGFGFDNTIKKSYVKPNKKVNPDVERFLTILFKTYLDEPEKDVLKKLTGNKL